jgi:hypothetical protein
LSPAASSPISLAESDFTSLPDVNFSNGAKASPRRLSNYLAFREFSFGI